MPKVILLLAPRVLRFRSRRRDLAWIPRDADDGGGENAGRARVCKLQLMDETRGRNGPTVAAADR